MMEKRTIKINFVMNTILTMSAFLFPLITFPYVSRVLGAAGVGRVSFAVSLVAYFNMFAQLGIPVYGIRVCAGCRDDREKLSRTAQELLIINLIMTLVSCTLLAVLVMAVPKLYEERLILAVTASQILLTTIGMEWLFKALEHYSYITVRSIIFKLISVIAMFALVRSEDDCVFYALVTVIASSASFLMNFFYAGKFIDMKPVHGYDLRRHLKPVMIFFAMSCATTVYTNLDAVMLGFIKTDADVGYYHAAVRIKTLLVSVVTSLGAVLLPRAAYYYENGFLDEFKKISSKALSFVFVCATPLMVYFMIYAREGVLLLSGSKFLPAVSAMQIIMPTLLFIGITNILGIQILVPTGREKQVLYSEIGGAVTDLLLNAALIPLYGAAGAAVGTLVAEAVVLIIQYYSLRSETGYIFSRVSYVKILPATVVSVLASFWVKNTGLSPFLALLCSSVLFFGVYSVSLLLMKEELVTGIFSDVMGKLSYILGDNRKK